MTTLHDKIAEIVHNVATHDYARYGKHGEFLNYGEEEAASAILKEVYKEVKKLIGGDEEPDTEGNVGVMAIYQGRNQLRGQLKSNLKLLIGGEDG